MKPHTATGKQPFGYWQHLHTLEKICKTAFPTHWWGLVKIVHRPAETDN